MRIDSTTLTHWADRHDARARLPILIRRLIRETTPGLSELIFPGGDAVSQPGVDGVTDASSATPWVPIGLAVWEMGCNGTPAVKADSDFAKRASQLSAAEKKDRTFIFVTPRGWGRRHDWAKANLDGTWAGVRAYDGSDLETWLDEAPATQAWLSHQLGLTSQGVVAPVAWWTGWSSVCHPAIPADLLTARRNGETDRLTEALRTGERTVSVAGDDKDEAIAFTIATLLQEGSEDLLDRTFVLTNANALPALRQNVPPILIADLPEGADLSEADRSKLTLIRPYAKGRLPERAHIELSYVGSDAFRRNLEGMGHRREEAERLAQDTGHSVTVLRRRLSDDPDVRQPAWARDQTARALLPFALVGSWLDHNDHDLTVLSLLAEKTPVQLTADRDYLLRLDDAPVARYGSVNVTVSQLDALFALGPQITEADLTRFLDVIVEVLAERDPALDLPKGDWWAAGIHGKARPLSGGLVSGLCDALCILAVQGDAICGRRLGIDLAFRISRVVSRLLTDLTDEQWISRRHLLTSLAEASPTAFLGRLEAELARPQPTIGAIMGSTGNGGIGDECLRVRLLWALESLSWFPQHFKRVATIVMDLRRFDAADNWGNSTAATAAALFRAWLPSTTVSVADRMAILRQLAAIHRAPVIAVCLSLLPQPFRSASLTARPRWLLLDGDPPEATNFDVQKAAIEASRLLLDLRPFSTDELVQLLDHADKLHPDDQQRLVAAITDWASGSPEEDKGRVRDMARSVLNQLVGPSGPEESAVQIVRQVLGLLEPDRPEDRHRWLFAQPHVTWPELLSDLRAEKITFDDERRLVRNRRRAALTEIGAGSEMRRVFDFAMTLEQPGIVADTIFDGTTPDDQFLEWAKLALAHEGAAARDFLFSLFWHATSRDLAGFVGNLARVLSADDDIRHAIASALPGTSAGWAAAERLGVKAEAHYWRTANILGFWEDGNNARFAVERLLEARRPRSAFEAAKWHPEHLPGSDWLRVLEAILTVDDANGPMPDAYHLTKVLSRLDDDPHVTDTEIARLELPFGAALRHYGRGRPDRQLAIHRLFARSPADFVQLVCWLHSPDNDGDDGELENLEPDMIRHRADMAYNALDSWSALPATDASGNVDETMFHGWIREAYELSKAKGRLSPMECWLGATLGRFASGIPFADWLPRPLADLLDRQSSAELRRHFQIGVLNARGITSRDPFEGGVQERDLASQFSSVADRYRLTHPRLAEALEAIASRYDRDGRQQDDSAALGERWHP